MPLGRYIIKPSSWNQKSVYIKYKKDLGYSSSNTLKRHLFLKNHCFVNLAKNVLVNLIFSLYSLCKSKM